VSPQKPIDPDPDRTALDDARPERPAAGETLGPGDRLGPYRIERQVGEGGMGTVLRAEQLEPVRRPVALKLIRRQLLGSLAEAYFEVERQALAEMDHPAIAKVFDAGRTPEGYPWFAMEWIDGATLDAWCEQSHPSREARLRVFAALARGVHHAHQRGIIHRDLKPSNVLVASVDGQPHPKIIDFGVAISIGRGENAHTAPSYDRAGTGPYMSPEQTGNDHRGIDTRSDVYALGVILLWLMLPSGAFNRLAAERSTRAELHDWLIGSLRGGVDEPALAQIPPELRWIIAHATEVDRDARYPSAQALAEDLERYRDGYAVAAVPTTRAYRMRKFARRHRGALVASAAVALALVAGLFAALYGLDRAEREALKARKVADVLADVLGGVDPDRARDLDKTLLRLVLDEAAGKARNELASQPDVLLEIEDVIGQSYAGLADTERALAFAKSAYERAQANGAPADQRARIGRHYVDALVDSGEAEEAATLGDRVVGDARKELGPDAIDTRIAEVGLGWALRERGRFKEAEVLTGGAATSLARQLGPEDEKGRNARYYHAVLLTDLGRFDEGQRELDTLIAASTRIDGIAHPKTLRLRNSLAVLFLEAKRYADAERVLKDALPDYEKTYGADHSATIATIGNLGGALRQGGKVEESGPYYRRAADGFAAKLGDDHPRAIMTRHNYGNYLLDAGDAQASLDTQKAVYARAVKTFGGEHPVTAEILEGWGKAATALGQWDEAQARLDESLAMKTNIYGADHHALDATKEALAALKKARAAAPAK